MEILALGINNLTDARYYAARGAHRLVFTFPETEENAVADFKKMQAILEWVEGANVVLQCNEINFEGAELLELPFEKNDWIMPHSAYFKLPKNKKYFWEIALDAFTDFTHLENVLKPFAADDKLIFTWQAQTAQFDNFFETIFLKEARWSNLLKNYFYVLQIPTDAKNGLHVLKILKPDGVAIVAGEEKIIGEKNYDAEDLFFDALEENFEINF